MKTYYFLLFIYLASFGYGQNVKIYGNIEDDKTYSNVILTPGLYSYIIDSKKNLFPHKGYFEFNISVSEPSIYYLYYDKKLINLYVEPNKDIQLSIDNRKKEDFVVFLEDLAPENAYFNDQDRPYIGSKEQRIKLKQLTQSGISPYFKYIESEIENLKLKFNQSEEVSKFSKTFNDLYVANEIDMAGMLYASLFPNYAGYEYDSFVASNPHFLNIFKAINTDNNYSNVPKYYTVQVLKLKSEYYAEHKDVVLEDKLDPIELYKNIYKKAANYPYKEARIIQDRIIGQWIMNFSDIEAIKVEINDYVTNELSETRKENLKKKLVYLSQYEKGNPAPIFTFIDEEDNVRNLREYVGKLLYIIVWSSEDKASLEDIPNLKKLYQSYRDNASLEFMFISVDDLKENWKKALIEYRLDEGIQGIAFPNGLNSDFAKKYNIVKLPSYIVIDKSSNIVSMNPPSPQNMDAIKEFFSSIGEP